MTIDVTMNKAENYYDLSLDANGDISHNESFDSSLLYSLLGERRADASEVPISEYRRGWLGNEGKLFENGSKLWLYKQARLTRTTINAIQSVAYNGLLWLIEDNLVKDITVKVVSSRDSVSLEITLYRYNSKVDRQFFELWDNTGA